MLNKVSYRESRWFLGPLRNQPVITVIYARRFAQGKCVLSALIPAERLSTGMIARICAMHQRQQNPPIIVNYGEGTYVRLAYRLPDIRPSDKERLLRCAQTLARWAREFFEMQVVISPVNGLIEARWRLEMF